MLFNAPNVGVNSRKVTEKEGGAARVRAWDSNLQLGVIGLDSSSKYMSECRSRPEASSHQSNPLINTAA